MTFSLSDITATMRLTHCSALSPSLMPPDYDDLGLALPPELNQWFSITLDGNPIALAGAHTTCVTFEDRIGGLRANYPACGYFIVIIPATVDQGASLFLLISQTTRRNTILFRVDDEITFTVRSDLTRNQRVFLTYDEILKTKCTIDFSKA